MNKIILVLLFIYCNTYSQVYLFKNFNEDNGLPQAFINDLNQDNRGFLYIATGSGLAAYDGSRFKTFNKEYGLWNDFITCIYKDSKNVIWTGHTEGKVSKVYPSGKTDKVLFKEEIGSKIIQILEISPDNYVFLKNNIGLILHNSSNGSSLNIENDNFNEVLSLIKNKDELLLLKSDGVYSIKIQDLLNKNYAVKPRLKLKDAALMRLNVIGDKIIIADNSLGILIFKNENEFSALDTFRLEKGDGSQYKKIITDRFANIYIATTDNGFYKITPAKKSVLNFTIKNGLNSNAVESVFIDREDNLWIGTYGNGLQQLTNEMFSFDYIIDNEGHKTAVNASLKLNNRLIVAGKKGIGYFKGDKINFVAHPKLLNKNIGSLMLYNNTLFFTTEEGELFKSDSLFKTITNIPIPSFNKKLSVNALSSDKNNIYVCTTMGLCIMNPITYQYQLLNTETGLLHNNVRFVFADSKKHLWICSPGTSIYYLDNLSEIKKFEDVQGFEKFNTTTVCEDSDNNIWISTIGDGVFKYNGRTFENYTTRTGLKSNYCYGVTADHKNSIWVVHTNGISYKNKNKKEFNKIESGDNSNQTQFSEKYFYYDKIDNEILFGTTEGIARINASKQHYNEVEVALNLTRMYLNDKKSSSLNDTILKYGSYDLSIEFTGICLTDPDKIKYRYKLEGLQDKWEYLSSEGRKVQFPKLKDGEYSFMIMASNNDGFWNSNPVVFKIHIKTPYWKELWFYIVLVILLIATVFIIIKARTKKLLAEQRKLEQIISEKTIEIVGEKEKIEQLFVQIKSKNKDITDSINYAKRIQETLLPLDSYMRESFNIACFYRAKDIVSGDFYWYKKTEKYAFIAAVDCTGHGVPGAFMSFIGSTLLEEIVSNNVELNPSEILHRLDAKVNKVLNQHAKAGEINMDGMDISLCKYIPSTNTLELSAAVRPILIYRDKELHKIKSGPYSIGGAFDNMVKPFGLTTWEIKTGDNLYIFSDGIVDQSGGDKGKKYSSARLATFLTAIAELSIEEQAQQIESEFYGWKGKNNQVDDVLMMSIKF